MSDKNDDYTWSYSFKQSYPNWDNSFVNQIFLYNEKQQEIETQNELARLDFIEDEIQSMESFPDAEKIMQQITGKKSDG